VLVAGSAAICICLTAGVGDAENHQEKYVRRCRGPYDYFCRFYLAAITHIMPVPEIALNRINEIATDVMDVLIACGTWLISFLP
jgi:hypothetical protein